MSRAFTASHRGGSGPPLVCLHGFTDTWRVWELVLPALERHHDVLAPTLAGHAGGPPLDGGVSLQMIGDAVERAMDAAGFQTAHIVGNSLGGNIALQLATRGRAESVVAFAPAGGWATGDGLFEELLSLQATVHEQTTAAAPYAAAILASEVGRRRATELLTTHFEHIPVDLLAHQMLGVAGCSGARAMIEYARRAGYPELDAEQITCPVRILWGTADKLLPWPAAAVRFQTEWLPHADWVELDGVGHCPQLDVPLEAAQLILGFTTLLSNPRESGSPAAEPKSEACREGDRRRGDQRPTDLQLDLGERGEGDGAGVAVVELPVEDRRDLPGRRADPAGAERLTPHVEEVAQREPPLDRRLDVDQSVGGVRVQPVEAAAAPDERPGLVSLDLRAGDADAARDLAGRAAEEQREVRVDVKERLLGPQALDPVDGTAGRARRLPRQAGNRRDWNALGPDRPQPAGRAEGTERG